MTAKNARASASVALTEAEDALAREIEGWLESRNPDEGKMASEALARLRAFGDAVFAYPSVRSSSLLRGRIFDESHLVDSLLEFSTASQLLRTPTKVIAIRGFLVAKFHAFSLLSRLSVEREDLCEEARGIVFSVVSTLIAEAVYFSCLDDPHFSRVTKTSLASDLVALWDSGVDMRGLRHFSALSALWIARNASPPNFGTMNGTAEIVRLTYSMGDDWRDFLFNESDNPETRCALEEFLFGLSCEEITKVRSGLATQGIDAVGLDGVLGQLGCKPKFFGIDDKDPRTFYDFFVERRDACNFRKKIHAPGPLHTLEEIYLKYRIVMELR